MSKIGGKCPECGIVSEMVQAGLPGSGILWRCPACGHEIAGEDMDLGLLEKDDLLDPGLTVGQLRKALEGVPDDYPVTIRVETEDEDLWVGGILSAGTEDSCSGMHFAIDGSSVLEDYIELQNERDKEVN